jgi:phage terminase large subunit
MAQWHVAAREKLRRWKRDPIAFVRENFKVEPDAWQLEALASLPDHNRIAVKACKGPGKTAFLAWAILWFLVCHPYAKVGCTSITGDNLAQNLWPELSKWMKRSAFVSEAFVWTKTKIANREEPETWFAVARTWPKTADAQQQADALAGLHADFAMFVLDESGGIPQAVMATAEAVLASGIVTKVLQSGNPTHTTGPLYRACTVDRALWKLIQITGDPKRKDRSPRISLEWAAQQIKQYGRDNPWVMVNVLGEFPPQSINTLLGVEEVRAAMERHLTSDVYDWAQKRLGVDVARFGDDRTVIFPRQGLASFMPIVMRGVRTTEIAARIMVAKQRWGSELELIDDTGHWGHGVIDNLITAGIGAIGVNYAAKALNPRYRTRRDEMIFAAVEWVKGGGALPPVDELVGEMTEPTYTFIGGQMVVEPKDLLKARIGRSPDLFDGLMTTFALPDMPGAMMESMTKGKRQTVRHDGNPWGDLIDEIGRTGRAAADGDPWAD